MESTNGLLVPQAVLMDREHVSVQPVLKGYTIPRDRRAAYLFLKSHHQAHTKIMGFELPATCGYTPGSGNAINYHEDLRRNYVMHLEKLYDPNPSSEYLLKNGKKAIDDLSKYGITEDQVIAAAKNAFGLDINTLYSMDIPVEVLLFWSHVNSINGKQIEVFNDFVEWGGAWKWLFF